MLHTGKEFSYRLDTSFLIGQSNIFRRDSRNEEHKDFHGEWRCPGTTPGIDLSGTSSVLSQ